MRVHFKITEWNTVLFLEKLVVRKLKIHEGTPCLPIIYIPFIRRIFITRNSN